MVPSVPFAASKQDDSPDYRRAAMWLSRPDLPNDPARWEPEGFEAAPRPAIATFYLPPTTTLRRDRTNAPLDVRHPDRRDRVFTRSERTRGGTKEERKV